MDKYLLDKDNKKMYPGDHLTYQSMSGKLKSGTLVDHSDDEYFDINWDGWGDDSRIHIKTFNRGKGDRMVITKIEEEET